jgi:hypothetical protein
MTRNNDVPGRTKLAPRTLATCALLGSMFLAVPAQAQPGASTDTEVVRDSSLEALRKRTVVLETSSGMSAEGELAAFDADTITLIRSDGQVIEVSRADVAELRVKAASPAPGTEGAPAPNPTVVPAAPATDALAADPVASANPVTSPVPAPPPIPVPTVECSQDPECLAGIRAAKARRRIIVGSIATGVGLLFLPIGSWILDKGVAGKEATDLCNERNGDPFLCDDIEKDAKSNIFGGALLVTASVASLVTGGIYLGLGLDGHLNDGADTAPQLSLAPIPLPGGGAFMLGGTF